MTTHRLVVRTKADLADADIGEGVDLAISASTGAGLDDLTARLAAAAAGLLGDGGDALVTRERQRLALDRCAAALMRLEATPATAPELVAEECRAALHALAEVAGRVGVEDILDRLFAGFCIGK